MYHNLFLVCAAATHIIRCYTGLAEHFQCIVCCYDTSASRAVLPWGLDAVGRGLLAARSLSLSRRTHHLRFTTWLCKVHVLATVWNDCM